MFHLNPYIAGDPIRAEQKFFGREDVLRSVKNVLRNPSANAIVLFGQRRIGKTSILLQLTNRLLKEGLYTPVYFDLQDKASKPLAGLLYDIACGINEALGKESPPPALFDDEGEFFRKEFLPSAASAIKEGGLVLLFDEFDVLDSISSRQAGQVFFPYLRQWMSEMSNVSFVFVIGRRPEDLSTDTHSAFKTARASLVSRLDRESAEAMIRQSEREGSLAWSKSAVERVWELCQGHAFLTQLLCSVVFERMSEVPPKLRVVKRSHVEESVGEALNQGANAFHWLWGGLPPAERVVVAAMAEIKKEVITQEELIEKLNQSGVRLIVRELEIAPDTLAEWELLNVQEEGYCFTVPLIKRWVEKNRPLRRVKDELDRLDPLAEGLFQTGQHFYGIGQAGEAESQLRRSLQINPNHLKSKLLLGRILVEQGRADEAAVVLEEAYQYDQSASRAELIKALLALAGDPDRDEEARIQLYEKILWIDKSQPAARERLAQLMQERRAREIQEKAGLAEREEARGRWSVAIKIYEELIRVNPEGPIDWGERLEAAFRGHREAKTALAESHEKNEDWEKAASIYSYLSERYPGSDDWVARLKRVNDQEQVASKYRQALGALETGDYASAVSLLAEVIHERPYYKESARHFLYAVTGVDVLVLQERLEKYERGELEEDEEVEEEVEPVELTERAQRQLLKIKQEDGEDEREWYHPHTAARLPRATDAVTLCPECGAMLKDKNLSRHLLQKHKKVVNE